MILSRPKGFSGEFLKVFSAGDDDIAPLIGDEDLECRARLYCLMDCIIFLNDLSSNRHILFNDMSFSEKLRSLFSYFRREFNGAINFFSQYYMMVFYQYFPLRHHVKVIGIFPENIVQLIYESICIKRYFFSMDSIPRISSTIFETSMPKTGFKRD